jgi:hypothetical protein
MATILFMKTALFTLKVGAGTLQSFQGDAADVHVEVSPGDRVEYPTLDGNVAANVAPETYALVMRAGQDYTATGLARFLWANNGAVADIVVNAFGSAAVPGPATPAIKGQVTLVAVQYGGEVGTFAEFDVTLQFIAKPSLATTEW